LGALVAEDAGTSTQLALAATVVSELTLALGIAASCSGSVQWSIGLLAILFLLRREDRIALAPIYGAGLLLVGELAQRSIDLRGVQRIAPGLITARFAAVLVVAAIGACGGVVATIAPNIAPVGSVSSTALGTIGALITVAVITRLARRPGLGGRPAATPTEGCVGFGNQASGAVVRSSLDERKTEP
jgi:hypothetical protein